MSNSQSRATNASPCEPPASMGGPGRGGQQPPALPVPPERAVPYLPLEELSKPSAPVLPSGPRRTSLQALQGATAGLVIGLPTGWLCAVGLPAQGYPVSPEEVVPVWMIAAGSLGAGVGAWAGPAGGASRPEFFCLVIGVVLGALSGCISGPLWGVLVADDHLGPFGPAARTVFGLFAGVVGAGLIGVTVGWLLGSRWAFVRWDDGFVPLRDGGLIRVDPFLDPTEADRRAGL